MGVGGIYGCGCKEVEISSYYFPLVSVLFYSSIPSLLFVHIFKCFSFLFQYFFKIAFMYYFFFLTV